MALGYKTRRRLALWLLLAGLPAYIVVAVWAVSQFDRPPAWLELLIYVALGVVWALPFKTVFRGLGQHDPDEKRPPGG